MGILGEALPYQPYYLGLLHCLLEIKDKELLKSLKHNFQGTRELAQTDIEHPVFQVNMKHLVVQTELIVVIFCIKF